MRHDYCYTVVLGKPAGENVGIIKRGETGYYLTDYNWGDVDQAEEAARYLNEKMGVDWAEQTEMEMKSLFNRW